jgi:hypothetical protein
MNVTPEKSDGTSRLGKECCTAAISAEETGPIRKFVCGSQPEKKENDPEKDKKKR